MNDNPKTILLVDDEEDLIVALSARLEATGYRVMVARDGLEGLRMARSLVPDLIILDLMLPRMDGFKVARLLKHDNRYAAIPVLVLTARSQDSDRNRALKMGADDFLVKPYDSSELLLRVKQLLEHREVSHG